MKNLNKYQAVIETKVHGIPCQIGVISYDHVKGSFNYSASSDLDYYGYSESDWELLDRRGYAARWLERKADFNKIEEIISNYFKE